VACWNGLERWLGVPWPVWGPAGIEEVRQLVRWADVVHVHDCLYLGSAIAVFGARRIEKPVALSQHIGFVSYASPWLNLLERAAYRTLGRAVLRSASRVVFCTPTAEEFVTALFRGRPVRATAIPNGIDTARFRPATSDERLQARRALGLPVSGPVVLFVGRLVEKKGVNLFLEVSRRTPFMHFLLVGDGPLQPAPAENLTWIPCVPQDRMETVYQGADVLLLPSHGEGFPLAVLEAMAAGLPVIVSKEQAFVKPLERAGACVAAERAAPELCEALNRLLAAPELAAGMGGRARELVVREWGLETMAARYLALLRELAMKGS